MEFDWETFDKRLDPDMPYDVKSQLLTHIAKERHIKISIDSYMEFILHISDIQQHISSVENEAAEADEAAVITAMMFWDSSLEHLGDLVPHDGGGKNKTMKVYIKRSKKVTRSKNRKYKNKTKKTFRMKKKKKSRKRNKK